jgi:hypothetical protein
MVEFVPHRPARYPRRVADVFAIAVADLTNDLSIEQTLICDETDQLSAATVMEGRTSGEESGIVGLTPPRLSAWQHNFAQRCVTRGHGVS